MGRDPDQRLASPADEIGEHRFDGALAGTEAFDPPEADRPGAGEHGENRRPDRRLPHRAHLARHSRERKHPRAPCRRRPAEIEIDPRGRPFGVGDDPAPAGKERLPPVRLRARDGAEGKPGLDVGQGRRGEVERHASHPRQDIPGEVVRRGAEPAGDHNDLCPFRGDAEGGDPVVEAVGDRRMKGDGDPEDAEFAGDPLAVRVEPLPRRQLVTDRHDLRAERLRRRRPLTHARPARRCHRLSRRIRRLLSGLLRGQLRPRNDSPLVTFPGAGNNCNDEPRPARNRPLDCHRRRRRAPRWRPHPRCLRHAGGSGAPRAFPTVGLLGTPPRSRHL